MIVCSCNAISEREIAEAVRALRAADPYAVLTPGIVFRHLGQRPQCGTCLPLVSRLILEAGGGVGNDNSNGGCVGGDRNGAARG